MIDLIAGSDEDSELAKNFKRLSQSSWEAGKVKSICIEVKLLQSL